MGYVIATGDRVKRLGQDTEGDLLWLSASGKFGDVRWDGDDFRTYEAVSGLAKVEEDYFQDYNHDEPAHATMSKSSPRSTLLKEADEAIHGDRNTHYGTPDINFSRIADYWGTYLGRDIKTVDVANMMILLKVARSMTLPTRDSFLDIAGYAACGWETYERQSAE